MSAVHDTVQMFRAVRLLGAAPPLVTSLTPVGVARCSTRHPGIGAGALRSRRPMGVGAPKGVPGRETRAPALPLPALSRQDAARHALHPLGPRA
jgi:hypothetical protein